MLSTPQDLRYISAKCLYVLLTRIGISGLEGQIMLQIVWLCNRIPLTIVYRSYIQKTYHLCIAKERAGEQCNVPCQCRNQYAKDAVVRGRRRN